MTQSEKHYIDTIFLEKEISDFQRGLACFDDFKWTYKIMQDIQSQRVIDASVQQSDYHAFQQSDVQMWMLFGE